MNEGIGDFRFAICDLRGAERGCVVLDPPQHIEMPMA